MMKIIQEIEGKDRVEVLTASFSLHYVNDHVSLRCNGTTLFIFTHCGKTGKLMISRNGSGQDNRMDRLFSVHRGCVATVTEDES